MNNISRIVAAFVIATSSLAIASGAAAQDKSKAADSKAKATEGKAIELSSFLCKDIMRLSGDDRLIALGVLQGYFLGKKGATSYVSGSMAKASDDFTDYCLDNPQTKALDAMARFAK